MTGTTPAQAPGHEDGCCCDPCIRAQHTDTDPRHQRCSEHGRCMACDFCEPCAREEERSSEIGRLAADYPVAVAAAHRTTFAVRQLVMRLMDPYLYDIETAEGNDGPDALHELDEALRHLRNVKRIADARLALEQEG